MKQRLRTILAPIIVAATIAAFAYYIHRHPSTVYQLKHLSILTVLTLLALYSVSFFIYMIITRVSLRIYHKVMPLGEQFLFNSYSSLINFFGPGQSGPIFRAAYLKRRHDLSVKQFAFTFLLYLAFFAIVSAAFVMLGIRPWWQSLPVVAAVGLLCWAVIRRYKKRSHIDTQGGLAPINLVVLAGAVFVQVCLMAVIYGIELYSTGTHASLGQILSYTGISNFSLYVALTPGAIGIREAFLVFSQNVHHISSSSIVAANLVDRAVYLLFLGIMFVVVLSLHAKEKLGVRSEIQP